MCFIASAWNASDDILRSEVGSMVLDKAIVLKAYHVSFDRVGSKAEKNSQTTAYIKQDEGNENSPKNIKTKKRSTSLASSGSSNTLVNCLMKLGMCNVWFWN